MKWRRIAITSLTAAIAMVMFGTTLPSEAAAPGVNPDVGWLRVIHASPDTPAIDIYLDTATQPAIDNLAFGMATDFIGLPARTYHVTLRPAGSAVTDKAIFSVDIELAGTQSVNAVIEGLQQANTFTLSRFDTDRSATNGQVRLEAIDAVPDAPAVDIVAGGKPVLVSLSFGKATDKPLNLKPATYDLSVTPAGTISPAVIDLSGIKLDADTIYTVILIGQVRDQSMRTLVLMSRSPQTVAALAADSVVVTAPDPATSVPAAK
ncbi:MAG TPA: DUF4397 domain-containing protein [Aggregatilineales bacterium]|nr:DUF4397 domain-containing protein [Aggregatilineales bacterium]